MLKRLLGVAPAMLFVLLAACATLPQTPAQTVYTAKATYVATGEVALAYIALPRCLPVAVQPCSSQAVVDGIKKADAIAYEALGQAETVARNPAFGRGAIDSAVIAARGAVEAFVAIVPKL